MNSRLETFCDGVFAIAITLLVLDLKVPPLESVHSIGDVWRDLIRLWPAFFGLCLSFVIIFISWLGQHNLLRTLDKTSSQFQLATGFFLFTLILLPFSTSFMAEYLGTPYAKAGIVVYSANSLLHNIGWNVLHASVLKPAPLVRAAVGEAPARQAAKGSRRGFVVNVALLLLSLWLPYVALAASVLLWIYWLFLSISIPAPTDWLAAGDVEAARAVG